MALDYILSIGLKSSTAYDSLEELLEQSDFYALKNLFCGEKSYTNRGQGEIIEYNTSFPESRDALIVVETQDKLIECKIYNHNNNVKICRRDYKSFPVKEDEHFYSYDYKTGRSSVSCIKRDVYINNDNENAKIIGYQKAIFEEDGSLCDFEDTVRKVESIKKRKYY